MNDPLEFLRLLRESFGSAEEVFTSGSCYQLYKILKYLFPEAEAWYDEVDGHVYTRIDDVFYDISGSHYIDEDTLSFVPSEDISERELESWRYN